MTTTRGRHGHIKGAEFIAWDGEGITLPELPVTLGHGFYGWEGTKEVVRDYLPYPQPYILLANSKGDRVVREEGLSTVECFDLILRTKARYPKSIFVGFGFNYDVNQILKDLPFKLRQHLHESNNVHWGGFWIKWLPRNSFYIRHAITRRSAIIYDVFGHFQSTFLEACKEYLGEDDPQLGIIKQGKEARGAFEWEDLDDFIIPYNATELSMLVRIMDILRSDYEGVDLTPSEWYGPGAVARKAFVRNKVKLNREIPEEVLDASQYAYSGGRFEQYAVGRHEGAVYEYDLHSAYPSALVRLPDISNGTWQHTSSFQPGSFGVWRCDYRSNDRRGTGDRPKPLFCRSERGLISYPAEVQGWYWTPEANLVSDSVREGWVFNPATEVRPFAFIEAMYDQRRVFKREGNSSERALKLCMNSCYGKLCQIIGDNDGPPKWHQLEYAGYITSYVRSLLYNATLLKPDAIIAVETDAVFSKEPLDLPLSDAMGDWELKNVFDEIIYLQSGFYYGVTGGRVTCRYRGMDKDKDTGQPAGLPYESVVDYLRDHTGSLSLQPGNIGGLPLSPALCCTTTRFIGMGLALLTSSIWRSWEKKERYIRLSHNPKGRITVGKRYHTNVECPLCMQGISMYDRQHPMHIGGHSGRSYARSIPWRTVEGECDPPVDWHEMGELERDSERGTLEA